jgi:hypothetical protein
MEHGTEVDARIFQVQELCPVLLSLATPDHNFRELRNKVDLENILIRGNSEKVQPEKIPETSVILYGTYSVSCKLLWCQKLW